MLTDFEITAEVAREIVCSKEIVEEVANPNQDCYQSSGSQDRFREGEKCHALKIMRHV